jgi:hypothetical protein
MFVLSLFRENPIPELFRVIEMSWYFSFERGSILLNEYSHCVGYNEIFIETSNKLLNRHEHVYTNKCLKKYPILNIRLLHKHIVQ